jgi:hypothetical protein
MGGDYGDNIELVEHESKLVEGTALEAIHYDRMSGAGKAESVPDLPMNRKEKA